MSANKYSSENNLILRRLSRNQYGDNSRNLPIINNNSRSSLSLNLSSDIKNTYPNKLNIKYCQSHIDLNPKLFKIFNYPKIKENKNKHHKNIYNKKQLFGKLANYIAIKKMKKYFYSENDDSFKNKDNEDEIINEKEKNKKNNIEKLLKFTNKKFYYKQKSFIEKIMKKQKNLFLYNHNNLSNDTDNDNDNDENISGNNKRNLSENNYRIKLDLKNINFKNPFNSLNSLIKNKIIYKNIIKHYKKNTIEGFENSIISMNPALKYQILQEHENILKQKKIKIFHIFTKQWIMA